MAGRTRFSLAVLLVGVGSGVAGILLTLVLHGVQHVAFGYTENTFLVGVEHASPERRVIALAVGGLLASIGWWWHRRRFGYDAVSVTRALREEGAGLPVVPTVADALLQVVAVGAGASLGREGAPRQTGAAVARWIAGGLRATEDQRRTLIACGAGAGLAAVYNVPAAGALFTLEVLLRSRRARDAVAAAVTAVIATVSTWPVLSDRPAYDVHGLRFSWPVLVWALVCVPLAAVGGTAFGGFATRMREGAPRGWTLIPAMTVGLAALGGLAAAYPQLLGNGKGPAELAFTASLGLGLALVLTVLKPLATGFCLRLGAIGGLMTPALATGACLGAAAGHAGESLGLSVSPGACALVGAAAVLAVTQRAVLTAVVFAWELVHPAVALAIPMLVAAGGAIVLVRWWERRASCEPAPLATGSQDADLSSGSARWHSRGHD